MKYLCKFWFSCRVQTISMTIRSWPSDLWPSDLDVFSVVPGSV